MSKTLIYRILSITFKVPTTDDTTENSTPPENANGKAEHLVISNRFFSMLGLCVCVCQY